MRSPNTEPETLPGTSDAERALPDARRNVAGAPKGNKNALKHGLYTAEAIARRLLHGGDRFQSGPFEFASPFD
jgi:hypothetical protein